MESPGRGFDRTYGLWFKIDIRGILHVFHLDLFSTWKGSLLLVQQRAHLLDYAYAFLFSE
jgi:hypothetical protein